jgi:hypothetical protein
MNPYVFTVCLFLCTIVQGLVYVILFAVIRNLLLSSLFNGLFLCTTIRESISQRVKTAETTVPFYQLPQKHKIPSIS